MNFVIAFDSFKGCLSSGEVNDIAAETLKKIFPDAEIKCIEGADGGEGTSEALSRILNLRKIEIPSKDPLGRDIIAKYFISDSNKKAFIDVASASGLTLLKESERNARSTSSYGTGILIKDAIKRGCRNITLCMGGSATNDAGLGMLQALGAKIYISDSRSETEIILPESFNKIRRIELPEIKNVIFHALSDINSPFTGMSGATFTFGLQKGIPQQELKKYDLFLSHIKKLYSDSIGCELEEDPGTGAAGGIGGAMKWILNADIISGAEYILESSGFEDHISKCDYLITGEGTSDSQTLLNKFPYTAMRMASRKGVKTILLSGLIKDSELLKRSGFFIAESISPHSQILSGEAILPESAIKNLSDTLYRISSYL